MSNPVNPVRTALTKSRLHRIYMIIRIYMIVCAKYLKDQTN
jgi:hypothetical protein